MSLFGTSNNPKINNLTTKILTRFNLDQLNLGELNENYVRKLKNPNKNSCLLTKLEILEKIFKAKGEKNNTISAYINKLKGQKKENIGAPPPPPKRVSNKNKKIELYKKIHPILMEYLKNNPGKGYVTWTSVKNGHPMTARINETNLDVNIKQEFTNNDILKIPIKNVINSNTGNRIETLRRISIKNTNNLEIDNVGIKDFFLVRGINIDEI